MPSDAMFLSKQLHDELQEKKLLTRDGVPFQVSGRDGMLLMDMGTPLFTQDLKIEKAQTEFNGIVEMVGYVVPDPAKDALENKEIPVRKLGELWDSDEEDKTAAMAPPRVPSNSDVYKLFDKARELNREQRKVLEALEEIFEKI